MYLKRKIDLALLEWKKDPGHKPLLLRGARQTGKTTAVRHLAESFDHYIEINFEKNEGIRQAFAGDLNVRSIVSQIEFLFDIPVVPGKTLLFLDEIQSCPRAISALRFFFEDFQELHVIAAGSLLEFVFEELSDFGVGRIRNMFIYPLSFGEFADALGAGVSFDRSRQFSFSNPLPEIAHEKMLSLLKAFMIVGGMPAAVKKYAETKSFLAAQHEQDDILVSLKEDFGKYKTRLPPETIRATLTSVVRQTCSKFIYSDPLLGLSYAQSKNAADLLERAKIVIRVDCTNANGLPLGGDINPKSRKYMLLDTGLYLRESALSFSEWAAEAPAKFVNQGKLAEMFIGLELKKTGSPLVDNQLYFWHREAKDSNAEVDYVTQYGNRVLPIEVKSGTSGSMKSLRIMMESKKLDLAIRTSCENLGKLDFVNIIPLYLISELSTLMNRSLPTATWRLPPTAAPPHS
jgi:predicted AAA+ superfamily ATPase